MTAADGVPADRVTSDDYPEPVSEEQFQAREYDEWFREVADPGEVVERDRRIAEAGRDMSDAFDAGDMVRFDISNSLREQAFWALPTIEHVDPGAHYDAATYAAGEADDDADGWY
jgi:hypothetical protein